MTTGFYVHSTAFAGEPVKWLAGVRGLMERSAGDAPASPYNTRRLGDMVGYSVEALFRALAAGGIREAQYGEYGVVALSHNGPCVYSEDFFRALTQETNPQFVSPMLFTESVPNIVTTHLSLALKTTRPIYALNTDLWHFFDVLDNVNMLIQSGQFARCVFCACEEFSSIGRQVFKDCAPFPGTTFKNGGIVLLASRTPTGNGDRFVRFPLVRQSPAEAQAALADKARQGVRLVISAFSDEAELNALSGLDAERSFAFGSTFEEEQGFMVLRTAELISCLESDRPCVLLQARDGRVEWIEVDDGRS